jgi:hypothetical protein
MSAVAPIRPAAAMQARTQPGETPAWAQQWLAEIPALAPAVSRLVGETREATAQALYQAIATVLARVACLAQAPAGGARLRGMLRLPGADASVVPDLGVVLDDERESESLMRAGAEALGGLFGAHRVAPLAAAIAAHAGFRHRASAAHVLELVAAIALARVNALATEQRLDTAALMRMLAESRRLAWMSVAPPVALAIGDERDEPSCERPDAPAGEVVFHAPARPSVAARVLAWTLLVAAVLGVVGVVFLL